MTEQGQNGVVAEPPATLATVATQGWCILRTSTRHTVVLAESLAEDGFEVWTPIEVRKIVVPRTGAKRVLRLPIMPSYVFARFDHLNELLALARAAVKPRRGAGLLKPAHAAFRVMKMGESIAFVSRRDLRALRQIEGALSPDKTPLPGYRYGAPVRRAPYAFPRNIQAKVQEGPWAGLSGSVVHSSDKITVLDMSGRMRLEIPTSYLDASMLQAHLVDSASEADR